MGGEAFDQSFLTYQFNFASQIALTPENLYTVRWVLTGGAPYAIAGSVLNPYTRGDAFDSAGTLLTNVDFVFSEGVNSLPAAVPEPSTLASLGTAGLIGLVACRRRRPPA